MTEPKGTIFIIDDDLALQTVLEYALRSAGYNVVLAPDGEEGLRQLETLTPDLVISDIMMPNMDGVEVFQQLKERLQDQGIPIMIMTALNRKPWFADLEAEGAVILQKPFEVERLIAMINLSLDLE
ncbi:MAG: response regulator [Chloroflexales bacterium]